MSTTPAARWRENGESDPHNGGYYDGERAKLCRGDLTDDEMANEVFLNPGIANLTAAKERIRWLSRALEKEQKTASSVWQPMETAPKDGQEVLLKVKLRAGVPGKCLVGHYMAGGHCIEDHPPIASGWYFWNGCMFDNKAKPIEWMPLPSE